MDIADGDRRTCGTRREQRGHPVAATLFREHFDGGLGGRRYIGERHLNLRASGERCRLAARRREPRRQAPPSQRNVLCHTYAVLGYRPTPTSTTRYRTEGRAPCRTTPRS